MKVSGGKTRPVMIHMGTVLHHQFYRCAKKSAVTATSRSLGSHFLIQVQHVFKQELILVVQVIKIVKNIVKEDHAFRCR